MKYYLYLLILCAIFTGCIENKKNIDPKQYIGLISVSAGFAEVEDSVAGPIVPYGPDGVVPTKDCDTCSQKGWLGDGRPRTDCPDCDYDGDGDPNEPLSIYLSSEENEPQAEPKPQKPEQPQKQAEVKVQDKYFTSVAAAKTENKPILVVFSKSTPKLLTNSIVDEYINKNYAVVLLPQTSEVIEPWALRANLSPLVTENNGVYNLTGDAYCVTNSDGSFPVDTTNKNMLKSIPDNPLDFIENLQEIKTN